MMVTIMVATCILRKQAISTMVDMRNNTSSLSMLKTLIDNLIMKQKKLEVKNMAVEDDTKEISTELVIPNMDTRGENMEKWRETLKRAFNVAKISEENSS